VAVILSAQCTNVRVNDVTRNLFRKYRHVREAANYSSYSLHARCTA
jgi:endonuclease III